MSAKHEPNRFQPTGSRFWSFQLGIAILMATTVAFAANHERARRRLPALRDQPATVRPLYDDERVVSNEQLRTVLQQVRAWPSADPNKINFIDHAMRMWGTDVAFTDGALGGAEMLKTLLHHPAFAKRWGTQTAPLLRSTDAGVAVATQEGAASTSHVDHLLGTLAESGVSLTSPITTPEGPAMVGDIMRQSLTSFRLNQREYEWTALALALYALDAEPWYTVEGQEITFDRLANRLMRQQQPLGVCYGNHRIYTLTLLLRLDDMSREESASPVGRVARRRLDGDSKSTVAIATTQLDEECRFESLLSDGSRQACIDYLQQMTARLCGTQLQDGSWDGNWPDASRPVSDPDTDELSRRILATGHALEWWAMAPAEVLPPRETVVRAGQWLATTIEGMGEKQIERNFTFLTHAARALALWRGQFPAEIVESNQAGFANIENSGGRS